MTTHRLYWDEVVGATSYKIYVRKDGESIGQLWRESGNAVQGISITLIPSELPAIPVGSVIFISMAAVDDWGQEGLMSGELQAKIPLPAPQNVRLE